MMRVLICAAWVVLYALVMAAPAAACDDGGGGTFATPARPSNDGTASDPLIWGTAAVVALDVALVGVDISHHGQGSVPDPAYGIVEVLAGLGQVLVASPGLLGGAVAQDLCGNDNSRLVALAGLSVSALLMGSFHIAHGAYVLRRNRHEGLQRAEVSLGLLPVNGGVAFGLGGRF